MLGPVLQRFTVVSLAINLPGVLSASRLSRLGAQVIKIEPPGGDPLARICPPWYAQACEGLEVLSLDLKTPAGNALLQELLSSADLLLTSSRRAALDRLGIGWPALHSKFPRICQVAITGYPNQEPDKPGHDLTYIAELGLVEPPRLPRTLLADLNGVERAVTSALALLLHRQRCGEAGYAEMSLFESAHVFTLPYFYGMTAPDGLVGGGFPGYNLYRAQDGWIAVAALEKHFWNRLLLELNLEVTAGYDQLQEVFQTQTASFWQAWAQARDLPLVAAQTPQF